MAKKKAPSFQVRPTLPWSAVEAIAADRLALYRGEKKGAGVPVGSSDDSCRGSSSFTGTADMAEALGFMAGGWAEGTKQVADGLDRVMTEMAAEPTWAHDVGGAFVDVAAYCAGDAECMWVRENDEAPKPRIRLAYNSVYTCWVDEKNVRRYAVALAALVRKLEAEGMEVELVSVDCSNGSGRNRGPEFVAGVEVRKFGQPLDLSKVAFAGHPSFLRRIIFAVREMDGTLPSGQRSGGYGYATPVTAEVLEAAYSEGADVAVLLPEPDELCPKLGEDREILRVAIPAMLERVKAKIDASKG